MALSLDFLIFGNGYGLKSPYFDDLFFWIVDTKPGGRQHGKGSLYTWIGGLGAQLDSRQWRMPELGERRHLAGHEFVAFQAARSWVRVRVSWALVDLPKDLDEAHAAIRNLKADLIRCDPMV